MKLSLFRQLLQLRASYWFVPSVFAFISIALSIGTIRLDIAYADIISVSYLPFKGGPEGARSLLSTVAGSMIGIAGVTFSVTIVALSLASSQFGPRLLRNFMRDRGNQVVLGTFVATFLYCLFVLQVVRGPNSNTFVPFASVNFAILLTVASLGVLIFFIHHSSNSIQADTVVNSVARELQEVVERFCEKECDKDKKINETPNLPLDFKENASSFPSTKSGYVQAIDYDVLLRFAERENLVIEIFKRAGDFVIMGDPLVRVWPRGRTEKLISEMVYPSILLGSKRTEQQDLEYSIRQLVEIAIRALSPSINDPFTAITCIDWLGTALSQLAEVGMPSRYIFGSEKKLRLITNKTSFEGICEIALNRIRQYSKGHISVSLRLLEVLAIVAPRIKEKEDVNIVLKHAAMIRNEVAKKSDNEFDEEALKMRYQAVLKSVMSRESEIIEQKAV